MYPLYCKKRKVGEKCIWKFKCWEKRQNIVLLSDRIGYLKSPRFECTQHTTTHCVASHNAILKKRSGVSENLIKLNDYFI